ncbi:hypothetical protein PO909_003460 [Leuciscus waleckii]
MNEGLTRLEQHEEVRIQAEAWKKRWFILRSGRMSGDPDVLEYYKSDHAKKPIRIIDLHCCEQVDAGLTFKRKEFQDSFVFDIKTAERTFYLVAETEEEMTRWVRSICQLCGFNQSEDNLHGRRIISIFAFRINTFGVDSDQYSSCIHVHL